MDLFFHAARICRPLKRKRISISDLQNLRKLGPDLEGHLASRLNFIDAGTEFL